MKYESTGACVECAKTIKYESRWNMVSWSSGHTVPFDTSPVPKARKINSVQDPWRDGWPNESRTVTSRHKKSLVGSKKLQVTTWEISERKFKIDPQRVDGLQK